MAARAPLRARLLGPTATSRSLPRGVGSLTAGQRRLAIALALLALVAALVVVDLPTRTTASYRQASLRGYLSTLQGDVAPCGAGMRDAIQAAVARLDHQPDIEPGVAATFTRQGVAACSFTNNSTVNLASTEPPHGLTAKPVTEIAPQLGNYVYVDAFRLLQNLASVLQHPGARQPRIAFSASLGALEAQRARIERLAATAGRAEGLRHASLPLLSLGRLLPAGGLPGGEAGRP